jgi:hypothetical protein
MVYRIISVVVNSYWPNVELQSTLYFTVPYVGICLRFCHVVAVFEL